MTANPLGRDSAEQAAPDQTRLRWDTSGLRSSDCNVANATSTREEVVLSFGVNENRDRPRAEQEVQLRHRIVLSAVAARRLQELLSRLIHEYEARGTKLK
jgi:hypothetical protein